MDEKPASSSRSGRRRRRKPSLNPAWDVLAYSSEEETPRRAHKGRRPSREKQPGEQYECVPDTPEDAPSPAAGGVQLLKATGRNLAEKGGKPGAAALGEHNPAPAAASHPAPALAHAPTLDSGARQPLLDPLSILLQQRDFREQAYASQQIPSRSGLGSGLGLAHQHPPQPQPAVASARASGPGPAAEARQLAGDAAGWHAIPMGPSHSGAQDMAAKPQQGPGQRAAERHPSAQPPAPSMGRQQGATSDAGVQQAKPTSAQALQQQPSAVQQSGHVAEVPPWPFSRELAANSGGGGGPGQALAARQRQEGGNSSQPQPATFLDRAVQLLREEAKLAALSQEQRAAAEAPRASGCRAGPTEQQRPAGGAAGNGSGHAVLTNAADSFLISHAPTSTAARPAPATSHQAGSSRPSGTGRSPSGLHPVSYHEPPPSARPAVGNPSGISGPSGAVGPMALMGGGAAAAAASARPAGAGRDARSPAEQLGLRRSGDTAAPAAESTPVGLVHKPPAPGGTHPASKGSEGNFFSPMDDGVLAQIESLERKAKAPQQATCQVPADPAPGAAAAEAAAAVAVPLPAAPSVLPSAPEPELSFPRSAVAVPPSTGGWSDTPDSAVERMLQEVEVTRGRVASKSSPAPVRLLAFNSPAGPQPAAEASRPAAATPAAARATAQPTSHLGRSALQQAQGQSLAQSGQPQAGATLHTVSGVPTSSQALQPGYGVAGPPGGDDVPGQQGVARSGGLPTQQPPHYQRQGPDVQQQRQCQPALQGLQQCSNTEVPAHLPQQLWQHPASSVGNRRQQQQEGHGSAKLAGSGAVPTALQQLSALKRPLPGLPPASNGRQQQQHEQAGPLGGLARGSTGPALAGTASILHSAGAGAMAGDRSGIDDAAAGPVQPEAKRPRVGGGLDSGHAAAAAAAPGAHMPPRAGEGGEQVDATAGDVPGAQQRQQQLPWQQGGEEPDAGAPEESAMADSDESGDEENERNIPLLSQYVSSTQKLRLNGGAPEPSRAGAGNRSPDPASVQPSAPADQLDAYLPSDVVEVFRQAGVAGSLYQWQAECLCQPGVLRGRNLIYCAPTSGGKSLVAEVLMVRRIMTTNRPAMLVLPFVSICSEKAAHLTRLLSPLNKEVKEFFGGNHSHTSLGTNTGVIVCTIEKANILVNRMLEDNTLNFLSCLVVDELHMVGDEDRGYALELLLNKMRFAAAACDEEEDEDFLSEGLQIIGMSATLPNVDVVARWLNAALYTTEFRPVPLQQYIKVGKEIRDEHKQPVRTLATPPNWEKQDPDHTAWLTKETVDEGNSVLIFCCSKNQCAQTAKLVARLLEVPEKQLPMRGLDSSQRPTRDSICEELRRIPGGPDPTLLEAMQRGVAFHHAGLSSEERELVERAYKCGAVSVLCATSTLAAGVNLPARRVVFRHAYVGYYAPGMVIDGTKYRQMAGRAGRAGVDSHGESYLIAREVPLNRLEALMVEGAKPIESCLTENKRGMKRAMLEVVCAGVVRKAEDVDRYIRCTLLFAMNSFELVRDTTISALKWLGAREHAFIFWNREYESYDSTAFGKAVLASGLAPELCMTIKADLERARESFVMTTELHLTYLCVPVMEEITPDWARFYDMIRKLQGAAANVMTKVGINPGFAMQLARGMGMPMRGATKRSEQQAEQERVCKRFWAALILTDLIQEMDMLEVQQKYAVPRGTLQGLQDRASRFASMVAAFCERLGWYDMEALITKFQSRVLHGVRQEILALSEIPFVKSHTARLLYKAGLRTPDAVAAVTSVDQIVAILSNGAPAGDKKAAMLRQRQALKILRGARELLSRRAKELREQAAHALELVEKAGAAEQQQLDKAEDGTPVKGHGPQISPELRQSDRPAAMDVQDAAPPPAAAEQAGHDAAPPSPPPQQQQQHAQPPSFPLAAQQPAYPHHTQQQQQQQHGAPPQGHHASGATLPGQPDQGWQPGPQPGVPPQGTSGYQQQGTPVQHPPSHHQNQQQQHHHRNLYPQHPQQQQHAHQNSTGYQPWPPAQQTASGYQQLPDPGPQAPQLHRQQRPSWQQPQQQQQQQQRFPGRGGVDSGRDSLQGGRPIRGRGSGGQQQQRGDEGPDSDGDGEGAAMLEAPPEQELAPDPWDLAGRPGPHTLTTPQQVRQMRAFLEERYECFAFVFDIVTGSANPALDLPTGPSAARGPRSPTKKEQREQDKADKQSAGVQVRVEGVALCWRDAQAVYVPLRSHPELLEELAPLFGSPKLEKATFDLKTQLAQLVRAFGRSVLGLPEQGAGAPTGLLVLSDPLLDIRIAAWMATPEDKRLKDDNATSLRASDNAYTAEALLRLKAGQASVVDATTGMYAGSNAMPMRRIEACRKAAITRKLAHILLATLESYGGMLVPLRRTEMPLVRVLVEMEAAGIAVSEAFLEAERPLLQRRIQELERLAHEAAGEVFNLASPAELSTILFEKLKLPPPPNAASLKSGHYSTNGDVLRELASAHPDNPLPRLLLEHRKLSTLLGRYLNAFLACLRHAEPQQFPGGLVLRRIRGSFNQTCTETGRLSMEEPNLQTVPKPYTYNAPASQPLLDGSGSAGGHHQPHTFNMRCALVAPPGSLLLSADYRQIEFRLMAHFSQDPGLLRMFSDDSIDPFKLLAARWIGVEDASKVTSEQRSHAKQLTYGILYGMGKGQLAEDLGITEREAEAMMASFRNSLPGIRRWQESVIEGCRRDCFVATSAGRRRWLANIRAASGAKRAQAERQACNTVCQGSAADLVKAAMIVVHRRLAAELPPGSCRLLLQIHDELLLEVDQRLVEQAGRLVRESMEGVAQLSVPLRVRLACGPSWGDLQELAV